MEETIIVDAVLREKTFIGKVNFPAGVPEGLTDYLRLPEDVVNHAKEMGLSHRDVTFLFAALRGKWALNVDLNLPNLAPKIGMTFDEIDAIVRGLIEKNYAKLNGQLNLYRFWIVVLHLKGIRFDIR